MFTKIEKKFVDTYITIMQNGSVIPLDDSLQDEITVNPAYKYCESFELFIKDKQSEMDYNEFENWYEGLSITDIDAVSRDKYDLPDKKMTITVGEFKKMINSMVDRTKVLANAIKPVTTKSNIKFFAEFDAGIGLYLSIYSEDDSDMSYKNEIVKIWSDYQKDMRNIIKVFNTAVEKDTFIYRAIGAWSDSVGRLKDNNTGTRGHLDSNSVFEKNFIFDYEELKHKNGKGYSMLEEELDYFFSLFPKLVIAYNV